MFEGKGDRPQWQVIYERLESVQIDDVVKYQDLAGALPDAPWASVRSAFYRAQREMEIQHKRTFANVPKVGYKMVDANEHEGLARRHHGRANRQLDTAQRKAASADRSRLTREERRRIDAIELNLAQQMEMTRRLEARVQNEVQERKAGEATLSERVDHLAALLEKHGIGAEQTS